MVFLNFLEHVFCLPTGYDLPENPRLAYSRDFLLQLQFHPYYQATVTETIPEEITRKRSIQMESSQNKKVTRRGRKKGGIRARLKREKCKYRSLPSVIMANVRSLRNKIDELQANVNYMHQYRTASILAFTETWLNKNDNDDTLSIDGFGIPLRLDRDNESTGKQCGGGVCLYVKLCNSDIELLAVSLRSFYLPREFPQLFLYWFINIRERMLPQPKSILGTLWIDWN